MKDSEYNAIVQLVNAEVRMSHVAECRYGPLLFENQSKDIVTRYLNLK